MALTFGIRGGFKCWYLLLAILGAGMLFLVYSRLETEIDALDKVQRRLEEYLSRIRLADFNGFRYPLSLDASSRDFGPSPAGLTPLDFTITDDLIVIYNRLPKTASTTLMGTAYDLCEINKYHVLHVNISRNNHIMSLADQARFAYNVTTWMEMKPAIYHGHFAYVDFGRFGVKTRPVYINVLRKPLDRLVSYYYFLRYGDDYRPHVVRKKTGDKMTFDECVEKDEADCAPENMWLQIPFFCGHASDCWIPGNAWALEQAKFNLVNKYLLVGVTEELHDFIVMLEVALPRFFKGATQLYLSGKKSHLRRTATKKDPLPKTTSKIQASAIWKMEHEFYEFALAQFHFMKKRSVILKDGTLVDKGQKFLYEKIRPK